MEELIPGDVAGIPGQRPGFGDPGDFQQYAYRGARGQVAADEGGPGPAHRQGGRGRVSGQAPGEIGDKVLIRPAGRAGAEHEIAARAAGQLPGAAGIARGDWHHPRGRPADLNHHLAAVPEDITAAQRHQLAGPQPRPDAEHHHRQRRGPSRRITLRSRDRGQLRPFRWRVRRWRPRARKRRRPLPRRAVHRFGEPVQRRPVRAPGGRRPARQAGHAERLDHVVVQPGTPGWPGLPGYQRTGTARAARGRSPCLPAACASPRPPYLPREGRPCLKYSDLKQPGGGCRRRGG